VNVPTEPTGALLSVAARAPTVPLDSLAAPDAPVIVVAPHPDDETLGCGAAIAAALASGRDVWIALLTAGTASHSRSRAVPPEAMGALRLLEFARASAHLAAARSPSAGRRSGTLRSRFLGLDDTKVPVDPAGLDLARSSLVALALETGAATLWAPWRGDPHADHVAADALARLVADALTAAGHPVRHLAYAVWGRFGTGPAGCDGGVWPFDCPVGRMAKVAAMAEYRSQLTPLIPDDPDGFVMPPRLVAHFANAPEVFLDPAVSP